MKLVPNEKVVEVVEFETAEPAMRGEEAGNGLHGLPGNYHEHHGGLTQRAVTRFGDAEPACQPNRGRASAARAPHADVVLGPLDESSRDGASHVTGADDGEFHAITGRPWTRRRPQRV